jgi:hypothetical protein
LLLSRVCRLGQIDVEQMFSCEGVLRWATRKETFAVWKEGGGLGLQAQVQRGEAKFDGELSDCGAVISRLRGWFVCFELSLIWVYGCGFRTEFVDGFLWLCFLKRRDRMVPHFSAASGEAQASACTYIKVGGGRVRKDYGCSKELHA